MKVDETLSTLLDKVRALAKSETVVGEAIVVQDITLIPISRISIGFAAGAAEKENQAKKNAGEGTGGGIAITPLVVVVVKKGQEARLLWIKKEDSAMNKFLDLVPDILDRFIPEDKKGDMEE